MNYICPMSISNFQKRGHPDENIRVACLYVFKQGFIHGASKFPVCPLMYEIGIEWNPPSTCLEQTPNKVYCISMAALKMGEEEY